MLRLFQKSMRTGRVTIAYPAQPFAVAPDFRGRPVYDFSQCIACGACASACPPGAITLESSIDRGTLTWRINYGRCIFCGRCDEVCPTHAISLSSEFELATTTRSDLVTTAELQLTKCCSCGEYFAPSRQVGYLLQTLEHTTTPRRHEDGQRSRLLQTCPRCKRRSSTLALARRRPKGTTLQGGHH